MPKMKINGLSYHYWRSGPPGAPHVVMIHGLGGNLAVWYAGMVQGLWEEFHVTTFDLAAHGHSTAPEGEYPLDQMLEDMVTFLDTLGIDKTHLVGHCLGGDLALNFAMVHPERVDRIVIIETVLADLAELYGGADWEGWEYYAAQLEMYTGVPIPAEMRHNAEYLLERIKEAPLMHGPAKGRQRRPKQVERLLQGMEMLRRTQDERTDVEEVELDEFIGVVRVENLHKIPHPVLLIYEEDSFFLSSHDVLRERLPVTESAFVPPAEIRHLSVLDRSKIMSAYLHAFLTTGTIAYVTAEDIARAEAMVV